jgi:predicted nucleic acid-binding protein
LAAIAHRYWDACAFLGWLRSEDDKWEGCRRVLDAAERGDVLIVTSALTIAEVLHTKGKERIPAEHQEKVEAFFRHEYIVVRTLERGTAEFARRLVWAHGIEPKDAVHVATALVAKGVDRMHTTDGTLIKKSPFEAEGRRPLTIAWPDWPVDPQQQFDFASGDTDDREPRDEPPISI